MEHGALVGSPKKGKEPVKIYPNIRFEHKFFPEVKKCEVEKTCKVMMELKTTGLSISKFQNDTEFDVIGFEMMDNNMGKGASDKETKAEESADNEEQD